MPEPMPESFAQEIELIERALVAAERAGLDLAAAYLEQALAVARAQRPDCLTPHP